MPSIDEIADAWAVRWDAAPLGADEKAELDAWLAADRRHRGAYLRARATLRWIDQARDPAGVADAAMAGVDEMDAVIMPPVHLAAGSWRRGLGIGVATMVACVSAFLLWPSTPDYSTAIGQHRDVTLADGSLAALNTDSELDIAYTPDRRDLTLRKGEAWFRVAHNQARPFEVRVGAVRVRATGTAFAVRAVEAGVKVTVTEGRVLAWIEGTKHKPVAIAIGDQAFLREAGDRAPQLIVPSAPARVNVEQLLAWRRGEIGLDGQSGAEAAREFNRYNARPIRIENARAAEYRLVGYFQTGQSLEFATALAKLTGSRLSSNRNEIVIE